MKKKLCEIKLRTPNHHRSWSLEASRPSTRLIHNSTCPEPASGPAPGKFQRPVESSRVTLRCAHVEQCAHQTATIGAAAHTSPTTLGGAALGQAKICLQLESIWLGLSSLCSQLEDRQALSMTALDLFESLFAARVFVSVALVSHTSLFAVGQLKCGAFLAV